MDNLKPFDLRDIDETLTRVVTHGGNTYLLFPYISAIDAMPHFDSVGIVIDASAATIEDFTKLSAAVKKSGGGGEWLISFSTPWLVRTEEVQNLRTRGSLRKRQ